MSLSSQDLREIFDTAEVVALALGRNASILRNLLASIPKPTPEEYDAVLQGSRPVTPDVFLPASLVATIEGIEGMAHNLRTMSPEGLSDLQEIWSRLVSAAERKS